MARRQARTSKDVIKLMDEWFYDFIGKDVRTMGPRGQRRTVLVFERRAEYGYVDHGINKQYLIGNNFKVEKYNSGLYYEIYRWL